MNDRSAHQCVNFCTVPFKVGVRRWSDTRLLYLVEKTGFWVRRRIQHSVYGASFALRVNFYDTQTRPIQHRRLPHYLCIETKSAPALHWAFDRIFSHRRALHKMLFDDVANDARHARTCETSDGVLAAPGSTFLCQYQRNAVLQENVTPGSGSRP